MSGNDKRRTPLVADRRYPGRAAPKKAAPKPTGPKRTTTRRKAAVPRDRPRGLIGWLLWPFQVILRTIWALTWRITLAATVVVGGIALYFASQMPPIETIVDQRARGSVTMADFTGEVFAWRGDQFGGVVTSRTVSPHLHNAVIATEDRRFYRHFGVSPRGIASAIRINMAAGRHPLSGNGGSTITQQTAKLLCLGVPFDPNQWASEAAYEADCRETSLVRKAREALFAIGMEIAYSKDEILTVYLNRAYLGAGSRGFEAAAQRYFGISAAEVNPAQAAMLAGLLQAPSTLAPTANIERSRARAAVSSVQASATTKQSISSAG